jgi:tetratricopeptide repeat protein
MHAVARTPALRFRAALPSYAALRLRRAIAALCLVHLVSAGWVVGTAQAQSDDETEVARQRFREGVKHYDQQEYDKARLAFLQAYLLKPHPAVLLNLAQSELRAGRYADAAQNFSKYIRQNPTAPALEHAKESFEEARQKVAELNLEVNVTGAIISIDGSEAGRSPLTNMLYLMPGRHTVSARKGSGSAERALDAVAGQRVYVTLELDEAYAGPAAAAAVPATPAARAPGPVLARGGLGQPVTETTADDTRPHGFFAWIADSPAATATVSVAGLALGTSAVFAVFAANRYSAANNARTQIMNALATNVQNGVLVPSATPCGEDGIANRADSFDYNVATPDKVTYLKSAFGNACTLFTERSDSGDRLKTLSLVSLGVGAFATVGTIVWYFSDTGSAASSADHASAGNKYRASLAPILSSDTQGVSFSMAF